MELEINRQALDAEMLRSISLEELQVQIYKSAVANVPRTELLEMLMSWLKEHIKHGTVTQDENLLEGFVKLLHLRNYTEIECFSLEQVDEVFNAWLDKEAIQNPAYKRRFLITQLDVQRLFLEAKQHTQNLKTISLPDPQQGQGGNYLLAPSCGRNNEGKQIENESTNLPQDASHDMSLGPIRDSRYMVKARFIDKSNKLDGFTDRGAAPSQRLSHGHSQDTGADTMSVKEEGTLVTSPQDTKKSQRIVHHGLKSKAHNDIPGRRVPPKDYICNRCHEPGAMTRIVSANSLTNAFNRTLGYTLPNESRSSLRSSTTR